MPVRAVVFDLDGTLYLSGRPYEGAVDVVKRLASRVPVFYLSNNTSKSPVFYVNRLHRLGLPLQNKDSLLSAFTLAFSAIQDAGIHNVHLFANSEVSEWFAAQDLSLNLSPSVGETELVLMAYHNAFNYQDLCEVAWRLEHGAKFWVTHADFVCPDAHGPVPDIGSFMALFEKATGRTPERIFGKPNPGMLAPVFADYRPDEVLFVGDRLYTDFELACRSKCRFALVLCGETKLADVDRLARKPEIIAESVRDIDFEALL
jgi:HAD superfamily hydrolase (TIGR01450 family)